REPESAAGVENRERRKAGATRLARRIHPELVTDGPMLKPGLDALHVRHLAPDQVLEHLVTVEAGAILSDLRDPGPHILGRRLDRDRPGLLAAGPGDDLVARQACPDLG